MGSSFNKIILAVLSLLIQPETALAEKERAKLYKSLKPIPAVVEQTVLKGGVEHAGAPAAYAGSLQGRSASVVGRGSLTQAGARGGVADTALSTGASSTTLPAVIQYQGSRLKSGVEEKPGELGKLPGMSATLPDEPFDLQIRKDWLLTDAQMAELPVDVQQRIKHLRKLIPKCGPCNLEEERYLKNALESGKRSVVDSAIEWERKIIRHEPADD